MDAELNRKSLMLGVPGIILQIAGRVVPVVAGGPNPSEGLVWGGVAISIFGTVLLILGLSWYAAAKGHHKAWGLMGLLSILGLLVLAILPDRKK